LITLEHSNQTAMDAHISTARHILESIRGARNSLTALQK
jgi:hypothetical protein